jgi:menaquinone-dependent protoporphyrinogen IX oxidase
MMPSSWERPHPDATRFVKRFKKELPGLPVALFVACLDMSEDNQQNRIKVEGYLEPFYMAAPGIKPVSTGLFAGVLDATKLKGWWRLVMSQTLQGDFRKWEKINAWAEALKPLL